ncbi:TPA: fimbrial protein [Salmonella enterica subsp. enterica serovar Muenchen]|nr:fimbrial protein [Salmonella enterica subsp. enterica serovar Muenchen]HEC7519777.1 fimbrial protein [Salmonella enterica subsp. enterica serovar Muenchen]HEC7582280.1 fimbrial protein [Salmonella enterica subsp. enterica serovar Muenchen]HEC8717170.1 fimbrial protein [Salmonella enterica subsp. enterica serovar Muenchen]
MFRKTLITTATFVAVMSAVPAFADVVANKDFGGGTINFTGSVTNAPCTIDPNDENLTVKLGQVSMKKLSAKGGTSDPVDIKIHLNSCQFDVTPANPPSPDYGLLSKVAVVFDNPVSDTPTTGVLKNTAASDAATNVGIQILDAKGQPLDFTVTPSKDTAQQLTGANGEINLKARMINDSGSSAAATTGAVAATVSYKLKYF